LLGSSHNINSNIVRGVVDWSDDNLSLKSLVEGQLHNLRALLISLNQHVLDVNLIVHEELDHTDFKGMALRLISALSIIGLDSYISG
jgi:hypothetical protein